MLFKSVAAVLLLALNVANAEEGSGEQIFEEGPCTIHQTSYEGEIIGRSTVLCPVGVNCCPEPPQEAQSGCDYVNCNTLDANGNNIARTVFCCQANMNNCCPLVAAQTKKFKLGN